MTVAEMKVNVKILSSKMYVYICPTIATELRLLKKARSTVHISARAQGLARVTELYVTD